MGIAKLPLAKEIEEFVFKGTPINAELVRDLGSGAFLEHQRNVVLIGGTGSGKSHLAIGIDRIARGEPMRDAVGEPPKPRVKKIKQFPQDV